MDKLKYLTFLLVTLIGTSAYAQDKAPELSRKVDKIDQVPEAEFGLNAFRHQVASLFVPTQEAIKAKASGTLLATFVISKTGELTDIEIVKDMGYGMGEEYKRVLKEIAKKSKWKPGVHNNEKVAVKYALPLRFAL